MTLKSHYKATNTLACALEMYMLCPRDLARHISACVPQVTLLLA